MPSFPLQLQNPSNVSFENSKSLTASNGNPFDTFGTQSRSQNDTSDHHSGTTSSTDFHHNFSSVHGSQTSDQLSSLHRSSSKSSGFDSHLNSNMSTTFATTANNTTNSIPLHQPSGSGSTYPSHDMRSSSYHRSESLSILNLQPMYEHDSTFTSSHQPWLFHSSIYPQWNCHQQT